MLHVRVYALLQAPRKRLTARLHKKNRKWKCSSKEDITCCAPVGLCPCRDRRGNGKSLHRCGHPELVGGSAGKSWMGLVSRGGRSGGGEMQRKQPLRVVQRRERVKGGDWVVVWHTESHPSYRNWILDPSFNNSPSCRPSIFLSICTLCPYRLLGLGLAWW
jgi:hypothetical protein